jgi:hypothetical protein
MQSTTYLKFTHWGRRRELSEYRSSKTDRVALKDHSSFPAGQHWGRWSTWRHLKAAYVSEALEALQAVGGHGPYDVRIASRVVLELCAGEHALPGW